MDFIIYSITYFFNQNYRLLPVLIRNITEASYNKGFNIPF